MHDREYLKSPVVRLLRLPSVKTVTVEVIFDDEELVPGVELSRLQVVVAEEGVILGGRLELSDSRTSLSVSPESLEAPSDEDWQG